eukprot:Hpha_TRINITY_DN16074_c1_g1::TRINITY_DN16074_c1_g1_i1::g.119536::m.119536
MLLFALASAVIARESYPILARQPYHLNESCKWSYSGVVLGGADVVAYFSLPPDGKGVKGKPEFATLYQGYPYWFANESTRQAFLQDPQRYVPVWGGFCAWGIAREGLNGNPSRNATPGFAWDGRDHMGPPCDPYDGWQILGDRLFCSINRNWMNNFAALGPQGIADGDERWIRWYGALNAGPYNNLCFGPFPECPERWAGCGNWTLFPNRTS